MSAQANFECSSEVDPQSLSETHTKYGLLTIKNASYQAKFDIPLSWTTVNTVHYGSAWVDRWSQVLLLGFWHVIHQNCRRFASVLYLKELYKFISSIWSKKQLKETPLRALKMPLNIFLQASSAILAQSAVSSLTPSKSSISPFSFSQFVNLFK